ncbi:MAG: ribosome rescue protein RqcH [Nitrososphaerales archaeon]
MELRYIIFKLNSTLAGYYVNNVYLINPTTVLIRLHHSEKPEAKLVLAAAKGLWLTRYELPKKSGGIASKLRREVQRARLKGITQPRGERIAILEFGEGLETRKVILEFFGGGNIIVTGEDDIIRSFMRPLRVRHRTVKIGEKYLLPPARGVDVTTLRKEDLAQTPTTDLEVSRWLGRHLALSKKYIEEVLARAGIDTMTEGRRLSGGDVSRLYDSLKGVVDMVLRGDVEPTVVYREGAPIDAAPFRLESYQGFESRRFGTFMEALDEVLACELRTEMHEVTFEPLRSKMKEISKSIEQQTKAEVGAKETASALREYAEMLQERAYQTPRLQEVPTDLLLELGASDAVVMKGRLILKIHGITIEADSHESLMKIASQIFGEAKKLERKVDAIKKAQVRLKAEVEHLERELQERTVEVGREKPEVKREKAWYERYRWFRTSEGFLAVGGRDASTNSIVINRYTEEKDFVFHADLHGSPFFILKGHTPSGKSIEEVAQATVIFSRAWKDGLSAADAYWIHPHQVKRQAPSGMYLPRGSFLIQGSKNYIKNLKVECAVGLTTLDGYLTVVSGPPEAVRLNSVAYVVLLPDRGKTSDTAKKIRSELTGLLDKEAAYVKRMPIDDFVRVLPSGAGRIVLKRRGEQRYKRLERS